MRANVAFFTMVLCGAVVSCSGGTTKPDKPSDGLYEIEFPSTAAAVAATTVQAFVYGNPSAAAKTDCTSLIVARQSATDLPAAEAQTTQVALCDVLGSAPKGGVLPSVPYGNVSVLVVAQRNGIDYFTGCALATLAKDSPPVTVQLQQASATSRVPSTTCTSVSAFCASPPTCCVGCDGGT